MVPRMRRTPLVFLAALLSVSLVACGGGGDDAEDDVGDDDGGDDDDAMVDAAPAAYSGIGETCDTTDATSCPADFACLAANEFTNPWCSKPCTEEGMVDPVCTDGYDGPGLAGCFIQVMGPVNGTFCGVVCQAPAGQCPACDGTCPDDLTCGTPDANGVAICL
jgi:hypothetical protein